MKEKYVLLYWEWLDPDASNDELEDNFIMTFKRFKTEEEMRNFIKEDDGYEIESVIDMIKVDEFLK